MVNEILIWRNTCGIPWWISKIRTYWNRQQGGMISDQIHKREGIIVYICLSPLCFLILNGVSMLLWWSVLSWILKRCPSVNFWNSFILMQLPLFCCSILWTPAPLLPRIQCSASSVLGFVSLHCCLETF